MINKNEANSYMVLGFRDVSVLRQWRSQVIGIGWAPAVRWPISLALRARLRDMSGTNVVLWAGTCPGRPVLCYATVLRTAGEPVA